MLAIWGAAKTITGVAISGGGLGLLSSAMQLWTTLASCATVHVGIKLAVSGLDSFRFLLNTVAAPSPKGTTARVWLTAIATFVALTTLAAATPQTAAVANAHRNALLATWRQISRLHLRLQATKVMSHAGSQLNEALRSTPLGRLAGDTLDSTIGRVDEALEAVGVGGVNSALVSEARGFLGAAFALPIRYAACGTLLLGGAAAAWAVAHAVMIGARAGATIVASLHERSSAFLCRKGCGPRSEYLASLIQVLTILIITKPFGLCGSALHGVPRLLIPKELNVLGLDMQISSLRPGK